MIMQRVGDKGAVGGDGEVAIQKQGKAIAEDRLESSGREDPLQELVFSCGFEREGAGAKLEHVAFAHVVAESDIEHHGDVSTKCKIQIVSEINESRVGGCHIFIKPIIICY